jgi:S1-C subfamily serine protease
MKVSRRCAAIAALCLFVFCASQGIGSENKSEHKPFSRITPVVAAVQKTQDSIVSVRVPRSGLKDMVGTGVIVDEGGLIITNRHVVAASNRVTVVMWDNSTQMSGEVIHMDANTDLALVRVKTSKKLQALKPAPVNDLMPGETVIAIGHPYGYTNTVSTGIISALGREIRMPTGDTLTGLIQTSAPINPGNSGGPLLNINGEFIGVNVALREGAQCIAFAINAGTVERLLAKHARGLAAAQHGLEYEGKVLGETGDRQRVVVATSSPETKADLKKGDEILTVGDRMIRTAFDLERSVLNKKPGDQVSVKINRDGKELTVQLTLLPSQGGSVAQTTSPRSQPANTSYSAVADRNR